MKEKNLVFHIGYMYRYNPMVLELMEQIETGLYVDEANAQGCFRSKKRAEYLERAVYICPFCGFSKWESKGNHITCTTCGRKVHYGEDKRLKGVKADYFKEGNWYKYTYGESEDYNEIAKIKKQISDKFKDAFIIAFLNGEKINTGKAIEMFKKQKGTK